MAISAATVWEVRTTGSDSNGGGFVAGSGGTDYSQSDTPICTGTVTSSTTTVTATTGIFTAAMVGNLITDGTTWKQITGYTSTTVVTVDSAPSWTSAGIKVGGALASVVKLAAVMVASNRAFIKSGTYVSASAINFNQGQYIPSGTVTQSQISGYASVRGDITPFTTNQSSRPQILGSTLNQQILVFINRSWFVENLILGPSGVATCLIGINFGAGSAIECTAVNCKAVAFSNAGLSMSMNGTAWYCEATGGTAGVGISGGMLLNCHSHDHSGASGINLSENGVACNNLIANCAGSTSDGIVIGDARNPTVLGNTVYASGRDGIRFTSTYSVFGLVRGNILAGNGSYGFNVSSGAYPARPNYDGNAYWSNTSGTRHSADDLGATNPIDGVAPYSNSFDVILTADPFVAKASNDFRLNTTAGGGAACRGHGVPQSWPGNTPTVSAPDMGAVQHADPAVAPTYSSY